MCPTTYNHATFFHQIVFNNENDTFSSFTHKILPPPIKNNLFLILSFFWVFVPFKSFLHAQPCGPEVSFPQDDNVGVDILLGICDLQFPLSLSYLLPLELTPGSYTFQVGVTFNPNNFSYASGLEGNITTEPAPNNEIKISGLMTVDLNEPIIPVLQNIILNRLLPFDNSIRFIRIDVQYNNCPAFQGTVTFDIQPHQDMRYFPNNENRLSEMIGMVYNPNNCPPSNFFSPNLLIDDELIIDQDYGICGDNSGAIPVPVKLALMPGAKIIVKPGVNFALNRVSIFSCGSELGQGIVLEGPTDGKPGALLDCELSGIRDCRFGIDAQPGTTLRLVNDTLENNYIGVNLDMSGGAPNNERVTINAFSGNIFRTVGVLKIQFTNMLELVNSLGYCGIRLNDYRDFNIFGGNSFLNLANGIIGSNTTTNLGNMSFTGMGISAAPAGLYDLNGYGIHLAAKPGVNVWANINEPWTTMTFTNCITGVKMIRYAGNIENTSMTNVTTGIEWERSGNRDLLIRNNTILARRNGILSFQNEPLVTGSAIRSNNISIRDLSVASNPLFGIRMLEGNSAWVQQTGWLVNDNSVNFLGGGKGIYYSNGHFGSIANNLVTNAQANAGFQGIETDNVIFSDVSLNNVVGSGSGNAISHGIYSDAGWFNRFVCNCVDQTSVGLQFYDMAELTNSLIGNRINTHGETGLRLGDPQVPGVFIGRQFHTGNTWDLSVITTGDVGGQNFGGALSIVNQSKFDVDGFENPAFNPPVDPTDWFKSISTPSPTYACQISCGTNGLLPPDGGDERDAESEIDYTTASGLQVFPYFDAELHWKADYRLYRKLLHKPELESVSLYADFKTQKENEPLGKLAWVADQRGRLFSLSDAQQQMAAELLLNNHVGIQTLTTKDSLLAAGETVDASTYQQTLSNRFEAQNQYDQFWTARIQARIAEAQGLLEYNQNIEIGQTIENNHKQMNRIALEMLLNDSISATDLLMVEDIAAQCPLAGGDAVFEARALVMQLTGKAYDNSACVVGDRSINRAETVENILELMPNPTNGFVVVKGPKHIGLIRIFNQLGNLVQEINDSDHRLDLSGLAEGIYFLEVFEDDGTCFGTSKLVIAR